MILEEVASEGANLNTVVPVLSVIGTFFAALIALFKEDIVRWRRRPKLEAVIRPGPVSCQRTPIKGKNNLTGDIHEVQAYYLRIWVKNNGTERANKVQVFAASLKRKQADGSFKEKDDFLPMNHCWTHRQLVDGRPEVFADGISPKMGMYCDIGRILDPDARPLFLQFGFDENLEGLDKEDAILSLLFEITPFTKSHLIGPGDYQLELHIAAANSNPVIQTLELNLKGSWYPDEAKMRSDGIGIRFIK